jgi:hypothetical protein
LTGASGAAGSTLGSPPSGWEEFGTQFDSVATDLLLANEATVGQILTIGTDDGGNTGTLRSANASNASSGTGFFLAADGSGWIGDRTIGS